MPKSDKRRGNGVSIDVAGILGGGAAKAKKKIRDIERLLKRDKLPADVRAENQRALKALKIDLESTQDHLKSKKIAKKYHMVRFFERKKALRKLKQAKKAYDEVAEKEVKKDIKKARKVVRHCEIDFAYTVLFPKNQKYISLYPNTDSNVDMSNPKVKKGVLESEEKRREYKKKVEKTINDNRLPFTFEDALAGKTIVIDEEARTAPTKDVDAPEEAVKEDEEDDFFE